MNFQISQHPEPGTRCIKFRGDTRTFMLTLSEPRLGRAYLRTNIGHAETSRKEIIRNVHDEHPPLGHDWFDIPMERLNDTMFRITIPLCQIGHFEAKCFFIPENAARPVWPPGPNTALNVEPADTCCANILYNAFVRQFGPNKNWDALTDSSLIQMVQELDKAGYAVIPPSGNFRDLIKKLDFIIGNLGCRFIQLLPIHPTPTTYGRMGRFGSPYASLSFTTVDPALAEFNPCSTPVEQFSELVDAIHSRNAKIIIDIAINHTGWAAELHETHPEWLVRKPDGRIEVPGAWGVLWEDLTMLDYTQKNLWKYMAEVFLTWCRRGIDGFRCDAGYMIPLNAWKYIIASVRQQYPDIIFLLEGLGGKISVTRELLNTGGFNWAYSELFQNYTRQQIQNYLPEALDISGSDGITIHFAETHDNNRLASGSTTYAKMRTALCALCSPNGAFGFANGVEWYASEKINVHDAPSLSWNAAHNQVKHIRRLGMILKKHPAFYDQTKIEWVQHGDAEFIALARHHKPSGKKLLILANLDEQNSVQASWYPDQAGITSNILKDLITGKDIFVETAENRATCLLEPGEVLCLSENPKELELLDQTGPDPFEIPERIRHQLLRAKALDIHSFYMDMQSFGNIDPDTSARNLAADPIRFCRSLNLKSDESRVITWQWPQDQKREVMVPPDHFLVVFSQKPFMAKIMDQNYCIRQENSIRSDHGAFFAIFTPVFPHSDFTRYRLHLTVYNKTSARHVQAPLLFLPKPSHVKIRRHFNRKDILAGPRLYLDTNQRGGMLRADIRWGNIQSKYDALLAGNLSPDFPTDRHIMFTRCRAWLVYQDYSQQICFDCFDSFSYDYNDRARWRFNVPSGQGEHVVFEIYMKMIDRENTVQIYFHRRSSTGQKGQLPDSASVKLILRPDIENRPFHETTKAYLGPETIWPQSIQTLSKGFWFTPQTQHRLNMEISRGIFFLEPEWIYMVDHPAESERGLDPHSDLFSPGYFSADLNGEDTICLTATIGPDPSKSSAASGKIIPYFPTSLKKASDQKPVPALLDALEHYIVHRENLYSIIAGYPWFLDWGRDSLIVTRGLIAAGKIQTARAVLSLFGSFEKNGTIPNMIRGDDVGNRDTVDAPLWFCVSCRDFIRAEKKDDFLNIQCGDRTIGRILASIVDHMISGTDNGIRMDPESGLIFSPGHFTWMDTNHPAGTPRQGFPIEIQALWYASLAFIAEIDSTENSIKYRTLADLVKCSILELFWMDSYGYLSDCLHAGINEPARFANQDDALRPNQLFAITMGALEDKKLIRRILRSCEELIVPGAIRSLADRPVQRPLKIIHNGQELNDPQRPYWGEYRGDEDARRKPAYHNGTAWAWLFPTFCEAWVVGYGNEGKAAAMSYLSSSIELMNKGCVGHIPEILDGDAPHTLRGCDAQAWSISEVLRVWIQLGHGSKGYLK
ncbi:MAG: amylo-alpha-1,6-glucosidase [Desulfobacterales bacterium]